MSVLMTIQRSEATGRLALYAHYEDGEEQLLTVVDGDVDAIEPLLADVESALRELLVAESWEPGE